MHRELFSVSFLCLRVDRPDRNIFSFAEVGDLRFCEFQEAFSRDSVYFPSFIGCFEMAQCKRREAAGMFVIKFCRLKEFHRKSFSSLFRVDGM